MFANMFGRRGTASRLVGEGKTSASAAPDTSTPKARSGSRSSVPSGRFSLASSTDVVSRHSQSPVPTKRTSFRQQRKAADTAESVRLLTHQASVATAVLRRERAAFSGSVNESGRAASSSPIKRNALAGTQEARTRALFRDPTPQRISSETAQLALNGASLADGRTRRTPSPPKAPKPLLGKARNSAVAVSKILQIAQENEQRRVPSSAAVRQGSPPHDASVSPPPVFSRHSSARVENQPRATYPGMSAFEDEPEASVHQSSNLYSSLAPSSLSTPGNLPGVHKSPQGLTQRSGQPQELQGTRLHQNTESRVPPVFARLSAASQSPPPVVNRPRPPHPEQSVQHSTSVASAGRQPSHTGISAERGRSGKIYSAHSPPPGSRVAGAHGRSKCAARSSSPPRSRVPSASPPRLPPGSHSAAAVARRQQRIAQQLEANPPPAEKVAAPSASPPRLPPGSHSAAAVARRQQRIAQQLEASPPPVEEEVVPTVGAGKTLSMAKLAELSRPRIKMPGLPKARSRNSEESGSGIHKSPPRSTPQMSKSPSTVQKPQPKLPQPPSKLHKSPSKIAKPQSGPKKSHSQPAQPQSKLVPPQSKVGQPKSKLAQPGSKLGVLQQANKGHPIASVELQVLLAQAKEAQEHLEKLGQVPDGTDVLVNSESHGTDVQQTGEASAPAPEEPHSESVGNQKQADAQKPAGFFGALTSLWRKPQAEPASVVNDTAAQPSEHQQQPVQQQEECVAETTAGDTDPAAEPLKSSSAGGSTELVPQTGQHAPELTLDAAAVSEVITPVGDGRPSHIVVQPTPAPSIPSSSATAPFATDDTQPHTMTSITRPSRNSVLPQQAVMHHASHSAFPRKLLSLPMATAAQVEGSRRALETAPAPHAMDSTNSLRQQGSQQIASREGSMQQGLHVAEAYPGADMSDMSTVGLAGVSTGHPGVYHASRPLPPASATAPFATEDTPHHTVTSITRPGQSTVLPPQAFIPNTSYTTAQQHLMSLPLLKADRPEGSIRALNSARRPHPLESISFLQQPQPSGFAPAALGAAATPADHPDLIRLGTSPLGTGSGEAPSQIPVDSFSMEPMQRAPVAQDDVAMLMYPEKSASATLSGSQGPDAPGSGGASRRQSSVSQDEAGNFLYPDKTPRSSRTSSKLNSTSNHPGAPSGVLTPVAVSFVSHPSHSRGVSNSSVVLPSYPTPPDTSAPSTPGGQQMRAHKGSAGTLLGQDAAFYSTGADGQVPVLYSVAPQFKETAFLPSSNESRPSRQNTFTPAPDTSVQPNGGFQPLVVGSASGQAGGNTLDAPVLDGATGRHTGAAGAGFLSNLSDLKPGLTPMQQAMQQRAKVGLKADLDKQVAEKKRRDAEEKAAKRAEDTEEERKVLNYLSTQAAHIRTRTMNPQQAAELSNGIVTDGAVGTSTTILGARPSQINLSRPERRSVGLNWSSRDSSAGHITGLADESQGGGFSGPMGPGAAPPSAPSARHEDSSSLPSSAAGDSRSHDQHMAALRTTLGVDFIDDGPLRGPVREGHGTQTQRLTQQPQPSSGSAARPAGAAALPDLLREVQQEQMRLKAQFAEQLEGYGPAASHAGPRKTNQWPDEERRAPTQQLAHVEDLLRNPEALADESLSNTPVKSRLRVGGGHASSADDPTSGSTRDSSKEELVPAASTPGSGIRMKPKRTVGTWGTSSTGRTLGNTTTQSVRSSRAKRTHGRERAASPSQLNTSATQDRLRTGLSTGAPLHTGISTSASPDRFRAAHRRSLSITPSHSPSNPSSRRASNATTAPPSRMSSMRHRPLSHLSQSNHSREPSAQTVVRHSATGSMDSSVRTPALRAATPRMDDELVSNSVLLPPSLGFVPDDPEKARLSEAAVNAFQSGRMRSASRARHAEGAGNVYIPPDHDDEVRIEQSPSVSPELAGGSMRHVPEGASDGSIATRRSSTSPLRHGFSKSIGDCSFSSQVGDPVRRSTDARLSMDASADGPSWDRLGGSNAGLGHPPRNLLTQAAMQMLRESGDADSEAGAQRGRELGRHRTTTGLRGPARAHSSTGSAGTARGSTRLRSSSANRS